MWLIRVATRTIHAPPSRKDALREFGMHNNFSQLHKDQLRKYLVQKFWKYEPQ